MFATNQSLEFATSATALWKEGSGLPAVWCLYRGVAAYLLVVLVDNLVDLGVRGLRHKSQAQSRISEIHLY